VDFTYEVSRSLAACEGALLLVDASQGVEAQTVANLNLALAQKLHVIPVINKIDLPSADVDRCKRQLEDILQLPADEAVPASAKMGIGIEDILESVIRLIPPPTDPHDGYLRASVFDSVFDSYRGVVSYVRVVSGTIARGQKIRMMSTGLDNEVKEVGVFRPKMSAAEKLVPGDVGYVIANVKTTADV
jgi:GTP-binding protein LepA